MLVSFLVPVYNTEKYLKYCIDSLLVQQGCDYEIILLDDGSTDSSSEICDQYCHQYPDRIRVIHKNNEGLLLTRRRGFREAAGDWFICVDSDDYVSPELLQTVVEQIDTYPECDMVMYNHQYVNDQGELTPSRLKWKDTVFFGEKKQELYRARLLTTSVNSMCLRAIKRTILDINADYSICGIRNMCEDAVQVLSLYTNTQRTVYINKVLYYYRKNETSITGSGSMSNWQAINRSFLITMPYLDLWDMDDKTKSCFYTKQLENICNCMRWLYHCDSHRYMTKETIIQLMKDTAFNEIIPFFNKKNCSSAYSKISTNIILKHILHQDIFGLKMFFKCENLLRSIF